MLSQPMTEEACHCSAPKGIIDPQRENPGHIDQEEDKLQNDLQEEATVVGTVQILCCLTISSLGAILVCVPYSSHFNPAVSTILMSAYPFVGSLCATSRLISSAVSFVAAGAGLFILTGCLVALGTASQLCDSEKEHLSSLPDSDYYYSTHEFKDCLLIHFSLMYLDSKTEVNHNVLSYPSSGSAFYHAIMESSPEVNRSTRVITVQPNETVLTAFPYGPHSSLLNFLKGDPKVLGAVQILLALVTAGIGTIFAFNYISFSQRFPLIFFTGYPFWGALIFMITGYLTGLNVKNKCLRQSVMAMNVISSLAAVAGITFTVISYRYQHLYCQAPSLEGICVIGRIFFNGILSVLLIISIVELSISVTSISFRSKCWTKSNEIVFFLPSDVTQDSEVSVPEETAVVKFELQEEPSNDDSSTHIQPVFFGGYTFFKLRVSRNPLTIQCSGKRGGNNHCKSLSVTDEQQKSIPPSSKLYEEEVKLKTLPATREKRASGDITCAEQMNVQVVGEQPPEMQTQLLEAAAFPLQVFPSHSVEKLEALPPQDFPSQILPTQTLPVQALLSETPKSHVIQFYDLTCEDMPSQDIPSKNMPCQDMLSKIIPSQDVPSQDMLFQVQTEDILFEAQTSHAVQSLNVQDLEQSSQDLQLQNVQHEDKKNIHVLYQNMQSEVDFMTQEWKYKEEFQCRKSIKRHSLDKHSKGWQSPKRKSIDLPTQGQQPPRKKSLDFIKSCLFPKRHSIHKQVQVQQTTQEPQDQQAEDQLVQEEQSPKEQFKDGQGEDQQANQEESPKAQTQHQQAEDLQAQQEKSLVQLSQHQQFQIQEYQDCQPPREQSPPLKNQDWPSLGQQSQDWRTQGWRNKTYKAQECQFEMLHSLNCGSQAWQTQDLLEKEYRKQKALYQQAQIVHDLSRYHRGWQLPGILFQDGQHQEKEPKDLQFTGFQKEDLQTNNVKLGDMKSLCLNPSDLRSEDRKSDFFNSSCQSSAQDLYFSYLSNVESSAQQSVSIFSPSYKKDPTLMSCYTKDRQQSEDSD